MGKNELVKRNIHEVAQCDVDPRLREDFVVNESEAGLIGVGAPMPYPDGKKPTALDRATAKVREQLDPRLAEYRRKVASEEYNPKDHIEAMTAQEARAKGLLGPPGPTALDRALEAAPTQREADRLLDSGATVHLPLLTDEAQPPVPAPDVASYLTSCQAKKSDY